MKAEGPHSVAYVAALTIHLDSVRSGSFSTEVSEDYLSTGVCFTPIVLQNPDWYFAEGSALNLTTASP